VNGPTYFTRAISYVCKMFMKMTAGVNLIKLFYPSLTLLINKLECLSVARFFGLA